MLSRSWYWGFVLAIGIAPAAGCRSVSSRDSSVAATPGSVAPSTSPAEAPTEQAAVNSAAEAHAHFAAGVIHEMDGDMDAALEDYQKAALADPADESLVMDVTRLLMQNRQFEKALEVLLKATAQPKPAGLVLARLGLVYAELGKTNEALVADRQAIARAPDSLSGYQNLFLSLARANRSQEALAALDQAARQTTTNADFLFGLSELYQGFALQFPALKGKAGNSALDVLARLSKLKPTALNVQLGMAESFDTLGASDKAAAVYLELLDKLEDEPELRDRVRLSLADVYRRTNDLPRAREQVEAVLRDNPRNSQAYYLLGNVARDDKKPAEAAENFVKALALRPDFERGYYALADAQMDLDRPSDALATLDRARRRFRPNFPLEYLTAIAFDRQKAWPEAVQHFASAELLADTSDPKQLSFFYFHYGAACERKGDLEQAEKHFQKCLQLNPGFDEAQNYLGYMWAEHGMKLLQAKDLIEKAVKSQPKNAAFLDSLGWVIFKLNKPAEALPYILKAVELSTEPDASEFDHLGDIYAALKQPDKARDAWRKSLSLEDNETVRKKLDSAGKQ